MDWKLRVLTENPLNAETPVEALWSWITANSFFFHRNQSEMKSAVSLEDWRLTIEGEVENPRQVNFDEILLMPRAIVADTLECSGNGRSLLKEKAGGNPWTIGAVGNAVWSGVWLKEIFQGIGLKKNARHVAFEGMDEPLGSAKIKFIRSIPIEKAMSSTLLVYEMNGEPLPLPHGFPLRVLTLGWVGASCCKWLKKIMVLEQPYEGHYMDKMYRIYQKGEDPKSGTVVTAIPMKAIITRPSSGETMEAGRIVVLGAAYGGEARVGKVEVSVDEGKTWSPAEFIGPDEPFAWRQWQYLWEAKRDGTYRLMARATDTVGNQQPMKARWNALGYGNNGVEEHSVTVQVL